MQTDVYSPPGDRPGRRRFRGTGARRVARSRRSGERERLRPSRRRSSARAGPADARRGFPVRPVSTFPVLDLLGVRAHRSHHDRAPRALEHASSRAHRVRGIRHLQPCAARGHDSGRRPPGRTDALSVSGHARTWRGWRGRRTPAESSAAKGDAKARARSAAPAAAAEPKLAAPTPVPPEPKPEPPLKAEQLPVVIVVAPADNRTRIGVLDETKAAEDSRGRAAGGNRDGHRTGKW